MASESSDQRAKEAAGVECPLRRVIHKYYALIHPDNARLPSIKVVTDFKKELLEAAMELSKGSKAKASEILNMNRTTFITLYRALSDPFFRRSFAVGKYEVMITSQDEIPEHIPRLLMKEMRKYV